MKKLLLTLAICATTLTAFAQKDATTILDKYETLIGVKNLDLKSVDNATKVVIEVEAQGMKMPMSMVSQGDKKFRIEMEAMGQQMTMVRNGDKGWMLAGGQVQPMPAEMLEQQASQTNILENVKFDRSKYEFKALEPKDGLEVIEMTEKANPTQISKLFFDKEGFLTKTQTNIEGQEVAVVMKDYKQMGEIKIPTIMETSMGGKNAATILIKEIELDYPTAEWMFAEPTAKK